MIVLEHWRRLPGALKRRLWPAALALLLLTIVLAAFVDERGGWVNTLGLPPALDGSSPASQNGFTLLELQAPDEWDDYRYPSQPGAEGGGTQAEPELLPTFSMDRTVGGAWISLPAGTSFGGKDLTMTGRASTGETFPLRVMLPHSGGMGQLLFTALPGGYPDALRYVDLTLTSRQGQAAHWRITRLPRMQHATPPVGASDTFDGGGARLTLQATRQPYQGRPGAYIRCRLTPAIAPHSHQWEVGFSGTGRFQTDWQGYPRAAQGQGSMPLTGPGAQQMIAFNHGAVEEDYVQNPFVADDHFVTYSGTLRQFETYEERLTFHDVVAENDHDVFTVARTQTGTTPSGITVTLPAQGKATFMQGSVLVEPGLLLDVSPSHTLNTLPRSPLARIYHRPVQFSMDFVKPLGRTGWQTAPGTRRKYGLFVPGRKPLRLHDLTVIVRQRVDLRSLPLSLVAPIRDTQTVPDGLMPVTPEELTQ